MADATTTPAADPAATAPAAAPAATPAPKATKAKGGDPVSSNVDAAPEAPAFSAWYPISGYLKAGTYNDPVTGKRFTLVGGEVRQVRFAASVKVDTLADPKTGMANALALINEVGRRKIEIRYQAVASSPAPEAAPSADASATPAASA